MAIRCSPDILNNHPDFEDIDPQSWREAQEREAETQKLLLTGWTKEEWLSYVYHLVLLKLDGQDVSEIDEQELQKMIEDMKTATKHVMTPPYGRKYFNQNVSA